MGGTFTDLVYFDGTSLRVVKVPSTPPAFEKGVAHALGVLWGSRSGGEGEWGSEGEAGVVLVHGSTIATNALLERKGAPIAFVTTAGFRDMLHIGRQNRPELYNLHVRRPPALVARDRCFTVSERMGPDGEVVVPLDEREAEQVARRIAETGVRDVAVCLLFSFANPSHERRMGQICRAAGLTVTLSCDVIPEFREYERASTTAVTATLRPTVERYFARLTEALGGPAGATAGEIPAVRVGELRILHGGGGTYPIEDAAANAGRLVLSGPAGGAAGAAMIARLAGFPDAVGFDMGGTSTDVTLIRNGRPSFANQHTFDGLPVHLPMLDIHTVGAGGGSIAFVDAGGCLRVGPRSAGAQPGPACYGRGGGEPTVTDANVVLGRIPTDARFGELELRPDLARDALAALAAQLGMSLEEAALGVLRVCEQNMAGAVRVVTAQRGHDPRRLALVSFGGAGGLHACAVAELLGMRTVILPPMAGVLSALGMVAAADSVDVSQTVLAKERAGELDDARLASEFARLSELAAQRMPSGTVSASRVRERGEAVGVPSGTASPSTSLRGEEKPWSDRMELFADCRWRGQSHELTVAIGQPQRDVIARAFADLYETTYGDAPSAASPRDAGVRSHKELSVPGHSAPASRGDAAEEALEIVTLRVRRTGRAPEIPLPSVSPAPWAPRQTRLIDNSGAAVRVWSTSRAPLVGKVEAAGPLLLIDADATAFIPAGWVARARPDGIVIATRQETS